MNIIGKAGGILSIIASSIGILVGLFVLVIALLFRDVDADSISLVFFITSLIILIFSILMIYFSIMYMKDGSYKMFLGIILIVCTILSSPLITATTSWWFIFYLFAALFVYLGKPEEE